MSDIHGGLIRLGWVCSPNNIYNLENFKLWIDNILIYGSGYIMQLDAEEPEEFTIDFFTPGHKMHLLIALREILEIIEVGK